MPARRNYNAKRQCEKIQSRFKNTNDYSLTLREGVSMREVEKSCHDKWLDRVTIGLVVFTMLYMGGHLIVHILKTY